ncbi:MFS transporter [Spirillospora sp. CA-294931]|uniref:MFS transporter n=1 Tax=Spirillospora sp. CA-294931 TaxID=3240042 RepID=UPI003D8EEDA7
MAETTAPPAPATHGRGGSPVFYGWRIVAALAVSQTVGYGVLYYAFAVILTPMRHDLNAGTTQVTAALTISLLTGAVAAVPVGRLLDRRGGRALMTTGSVAATALVAAWAAAGSLTELYLVFLGLGLASAMVLYEPAFAVVVTWFHARRATALLAVTVVAGFASTIFMPLTGWLTDAYGWRTALLILAAVHGVIAIPLHALVRSRPADLGLHPDGAAEPPVARGDTLERATATRAVLRDPIFWTLVLAFMTHSAAVAVIGVHLVAYLLALGHPAAFAAAVAGLLGVLSVTGRLATTAARRHRSPTTVVAVVFALQALAALALPLTGRDAVAAVICVLALGLGFGVATIARPALLAEQYGTAAYGTVSGLLALPLTLAKALSPLAAAAILGVTGTYTPVMLAVAAALAVATASLLAAGRLRAP